MSLCFIRRRHLKVLQRLNDRLAVGVEQSLPVGAVVKEKFLALVAGTKVASQQGEDPVFRLNLSAQHAAQVGEADEAFQKMGLAVEMPHGPEHGIQGLVREIPQKAWPLP